MWGTQRNDRLVKTRKRFIWFWSQFRKWKWEESPPPPAFVNRGQSAGFCWLPLSHVMSCFVADSDIHTDFVNIEISINASRSQGRHSGWPWLLLVLLVYNLSEGEVLVRKRTSTWNNLAQWLVWQGAHMSTSIQKAGNRVDYNIGNWSLISSS